MPISKAGVRKTKNIVNSLNKLSQNLVSRDRMTVFFLTVADVSAARGRWWNVWPQNATFFFQPAIFHPNAKPAQYSKLNSRLNLSFSVFQLLVSRGKRLPLARGGNKVSSHLQTT